MEERKERTLNTVTVATVKMRLAVTRKNTTFLWARKWRGPQSSKKWTKEVTSNGSILTEGRGNEQDFRHVPAAPVIFKQ